MTYLLAYWLSSDFVICLYAILISGEYNIRYEAPPAYYIIIGRVLSGWNKDRIELGCLTPRYHPHK
ncbi:hypothetical protein CMK19_07690 [Candidatus Poribacteria bacterium]|nr:hypothetical protein [Candidatus Poribacteria bacterium]